MHISRNARFYQLVVPNKSGMLASLTREAHFLSTTRNANADLHQLVRQKRK
jgi:hypothetical protein